MWLFVALHLHTRVERETLAQREGLLLYVLDGILSALNYINEHLADFVAVSTHPNEDIDDIYNENSTLQTDYNLVICEKYTIQPSKQVDLKYEKTFYLFELKTEYKK